MMALKISNKLWLCCAIQALHWLNLVFSNMTWFIINVKLIVFLFLSITFMCSFFFFHSNPIKHLFRAVFFIMCICQTCSRRICLFCNCNTRSLVHHSIVCTFSIHDTSMKWFNKHAHYYIILATILQIFIQSEHWRSDNVFSIF